MTGHGWRVKSGRGKRVSLLMSSSMPGPKQTMWRKIRWGLSRTLMVLGGLMFWVGDRFLIEIKHWTFLPALALAIAAGILLMLAGAGIGRSDN